MRDLAVLVPSRSRPQNIRRLAGAFRATCRGDTMLVIGLDMDDPSLHDCMDVLYGYPEVAVIIAQDIRKVTAWTNHLATSLPEDFRFLGHIGDDNLPCT